MNKYLMHIKIAVCFTILCSIASFFTVQKGYGEIYPFFYWKLYSQPYGWNGAVDNYIIYAKKSNQKDWQRLKKKSYKSFDADDYGYLLRNAFTQKNQKIDTASVKVFCKHIAPDYEAYKIVLERYNPLLSIENKADLSQEVMFTFIK